MWACGDAALWGIGGVIVKAACGPGPSMSNPPIMTKADERAKRLADALRENLRRRKAQLPSEETPPRPKREDEPDGPDGELL
jgi:hypothetical protein